MSSKKQSETSDHPNINFLLRFVSTNYERRQVDEETCILFNHFFINFIENINKDLPLSQLKTLVKIIWSVFQNFEELNKGKPSFQFFIQLFGMIFNLIEKVSTTKEDKTFAFEVLNIFEPIFDSFKKESPLAQIQKNIHKMVVPKNMKEIQSFAKSKAKTFTQPISIQKYNEINSLVCRHFQSGNLLLYYLKSFLNVEGQSYLDIILELIVCTINEGKVEEFKKILKVYKCFGETNQIEINNICVLVNKILRCKRKIQFFYTLSSTINLEKYYAPNDLFAVCLNVLDTIYEQNYLNTVDYESLLIISQFKYSFKNVTEVSEKIKLVNLPCKVLKSFLKGRVNNQKKKKDVQKEKGNVEQPKTISNLLSKSKPQDLCIMDGDEENERALLELVSRAQQEEQNNEKEEMSQMEEGEGIPLKREELEKFCKSMKELFSCFHKNPFLVKVLKECNKDRLLQMLSQNKEGYNKKLVEFVVQIVPKFFIIKISQTELQSPLLQVLALRTIQKQYSPKKNNEEKLLNLYKTFHKKLLDTENGLNYQFLICHILHHQAQPKLIINYLLQNSKDHLNYDKISQLSLNLSLLVSCFQPVANLKFTTQHLMSNISKLNKKFDLNDYLYDEEKENKLFISRGSFEDEEEDEEKEVYQNLSEVVSKANRLIDSNINPLDNLSLNSFYKVIIELNILCRQKGRDKFSQSKMLQALKKMRNNNKFSMFLTLNNELCSQLKIYLSLATEDLPSMIVILHLLTKGQALLNKQKNQNEDSNNYIDKNELREGRESLIEYLLKIGCQPSKKLLELVNENFQCEKKEIEDKNQLLLTYIKDFQMIKFYSEMMKSKEVLQLLSVRLGLKIIGEIDKMDKEEMRDEELERKIKKLKLIYNNESKDLNEKERKISQMYTKIKLLTSNDETTVEYKKEIIEMLESNHEGLEEILIKEQEENNITQEWLFQEKTGLMGYLLETMVNNLKGKSELSILLLNMLKTIIDNSSNILKITQDEMLKKLKNKNVTNLIIERTEHGVEMVGKAESKQKEVEEFLEQSKKMYSIIGKVINLSEIKIQTLFQKIIQLDQVKSPTISLYILRELVNVGIIIRTLSINQEEQQSLTEVIFSYLMKIKETYTDQSIPHPSDPSRKLEISSLITYFIYQFYSLDENSQSGNASQSGIKVNVQPSCLMNRKVSNFRCLSCDEELQICINCAIECHSGHPIVHNIGNYQISKFCQCRQTNNCRLVVSKKGGKKPSGNVPFGENPFEDYYDFKRKDIFRVNPNQSLELEKERQKQKAKKLLGLYDDDQSFEMFGDQGQEDLMFQFGGRNKIPPFGGMPSLQPPNMPSSGSWKSSSNASWKPPRMDQYLKYKPKNEERSYFRYEYEKRQSNSNPFSSELKHPNEGQMGKQEKEEDEAELLVFEDEDYEKELKSQSPTHLQERKRGTELMCQSYLLPIFMNITTQICEFKEGQESSKKEEVVYHIKLQQPPIMSKIVSSVLKMCQPGTFTTKIRKSDSGALTSPSISRKSFALNEKFVAIISGLNLNIHLKEKLYSFIGQNKNSPSGFPWAFQHPLQHEGHSVGFAPHKNNLLCVAGIHNLSLYDVQNDGNISRHPNSKFNSNNDNINKIHMTKLGIFVGLSKEIKLLSYSLKQILTIQSSSLIKEWNVYQKNGNEFIVYVALPDGYVYYAEVAPWTDGLLNLNKKINDSRMNRPVGSYIVVKDIKDCGTLMISNYKDKNIGHTLGRLEGTTLQDINYIKFINQGLNNVFDHDYVMGLTDIAQNPSNPKELFIVVNMIPALPADVLSIHRGILTLIKIRLQPNGNSKYEIQILTSESRCEYFEIVKMGDKALFILSLHEDGSLLVTTPSKIAKLYCENEIKELKEKKIKNDSNKKQQNEEGDENEKVDKLRNIIKETINIQSIKKSLEDSPLNPYAFVEQAEFLKNKDDYTILELSQNNDIITYEIRYNSFNKIITGISMPVFGDAKILTRNVKNIIEFGLTTEESLYFFAFGRIRLEFRKNEASKYTRNSIENLKMLKKRKGDPNIEELIKYEGRSFGLNEKLSNEMIIYGENFDNFKAKINKFEEKFTEKVFDLTNDESIINTVKVLQIFLDNSIQMENFISSEDEIISFVTHLRDQLIVRKNKQELCNKIYPTVKSIIEKSLTIIEKIQGRQMHIFNDEFHPLRYCTETKIEFLYTLLKSEITDRDLIIFIKLLYEFAESSPHLLAYYFAKYPSLLLKMQKRSKSIQKQELHEMLIPLFLMGYLVLLYLNYSTDWILPDLFAIIGKPFKEQGSDGDPKPSLNCRKTFYKFLKLYQDFQLEAWLKNIQAIDANDSIKDAPVQKEPMNQMNQGGFGGLLYLEDEEAQLKLALEMSMREIEAKNEVLQFEQNNEMQVEIPEEETNEMKISSPLLRDIIAEALKEIDYNTNAIDVNCHKVIALYVISKIVDNNYIQKKDPLTFLFLCDHIKTVMIKLCSQYQIPGNNTIHGILMLWMNLFGIIYSSGRYWKQIREKKEVFSIYEEVKEEILKTLKKVSIEEVKKANTLPNSLARLFKGYKITNNIHFIYGFIQVLQPPCEANSSLLLLGCYWLFPKDKQFYTKTKYKDTINEGIRLGKMEKIYDTAISNVEIWKEISSQDLEWVEKWIEDKNQNWELALQLLTLYYE